VGYAVLRERILEVARTYTIQELAFEPGPRRQLAAQPQADGLPMAELSQTLAPRLARCEGTPAFGRKSPVAARQSSDPVL